MQQDPCPRSQGRNQGCPSARREEKEPHCLLAAFFALEKKKKRQFRGNHPTLKARKSAPIC